ncbi:amino acid ABC transporter permease [Rhizobium sp. A37_96]
MADHDFVRREESPRLPPPRSARGFVGWLRANLFAGPFNSALTIIFAAAILWLAWIVARFALVDAIFQGSNRDACLVSPSGACWPLVKEKVGQWIYGFYPIDQRWRVNLCFILFVLGAVPMLAPALPFKRLNAAYLLLILPLTVLILLTGGNFDLGRRDYLAALCILSFVSSVITAFHSWEKDSHRYAVDLLIAIVALLLWAVSIFLPEQPVIAGLPLFDTAVAALSVLAALLSLVAMAANREAGRQQAFLVAFIWLIVFGTLLALSHDFGLSPIDTAQWGGLLVTVVVAIAGIVSSLPLGILLALGRQSPMPLVRVASVIFIEAVRGVPLVTVLFMSSVMLPLFLPPGMSFDKLLRALIGVALFSSAYMAEVVRGGLQAVGRGQYEGAMALGLNYWPMMAKIILPQALKVSIPNIVSNFISLFKDTTLVLIIGIFDLLGVVQATLRDPNWATPASAATGYLAVALIYWCICFGMSRYSRFVERLLDRGHKR